MPNHTNISSLTLQVFHRFIIDSNHNLFLLINIMCTVVYQSFPTSNHNKQMTYHFSSDVVYQSFPTSNHNGYKQVRCMCSLFINLFLHQTTTFGPNRLRSGKLFINLFLHQTTTCTMHGSS